MNRRWLAAAVCALAAIPAVPARGVRWFDGDLDAALAAARETDRLVLVDCWATWCRYCHEMDDQVWSRDDVARVVEHETVPLRLEVDVMRGVNVSFSRRYGVEGLPLVLLLEPEGGRVLERLEGFQSSGKILAAIDAARERWSGARAAGRSDDPAVLVREASRRARSGDRDGAEKLLRRALELDADCGAGEAAGAALMLAGLVAPRDGPEAADALLAGALARCRDPGDVAALWNRRVELARSRDDPDALREVVLARWRALADDTQAALEAAELLVEQNQRLDLAGQIATALARRLPDDPRPPGLLARIAWRRGDLDEASRRVAEALEIDPHDLDLRELRLRIEMARRAGGTDR